MGARCALRVAAAMALVALGFAVDACVATATIQTDGAWKQLAPTGQQVKGRTWHQGAVSAGQMYVTGGSGNGQNSTYAYSIEGNSWSVLAPMSAVLTAGNMAASGGFLFTFGGKSTSALSTLQVLRTTTTVNQAWETVTTINAPPPRNGHTTTDFGGIVYVFGGWNEDVAYYNDLWAFDTTQLFNNKKQWVNVIPNGAAGMPPARNSMSMVAIGGQMVMFGGFSHDISRGKWVSCSSKDQCVYYNDLWAWTPPAMNVKANTYNAWNKLMPTGSSVYPTGRWGQAAAAIGDNLFIFGGNSLGTVVLDDTWMYSMGVNEWRQLSPPGSSPSRRYAAVCVASGGVMYLFSGSNGQPDLWSFTPPTTLVPGSTTGTVVNNNGGTDATGLSVGLVIAILVGIASVFLGVLTYRRVLAMSGQNSQYMHMQEHTAGL